MAGTNPRMVRFRFSRDKNESRSAAGFLSIVMAGLVPAIHV
jgi:hypothetical protein